MFVKPAPGCTVPDLDRGDLLPEEGREVPENTYWLRRVSDRDVTVQTSESEG